MATACSGLTEDHCCYLGGSRCHFLEEGTVPDRRWACQLFREMGNWPAVHADPRYVSTVQPVWDKTHLAGQQCGEWPRPGVTCPTCGITGE